MKKRILTFFAVLISAFVVNEQIFAASGKLRAPKKDEVILIGRVVVTPEQDMDFYLKSRGLSEVLAGSKSAYYIPFSAKKDSKFQSNYEDFKKANWKQQFYDGEFFYAIYKINRTTRNMKFDCLSAYRFFNAPPAQIYLPFNFNFDVPEGIKAVYIGSFYFTTTGSTFDIKSIKYVDEYDEAKKVLDSVTEKECDLYRADLKENPKE